MQPDEPPVALRPTKFTVTLTAGLTLGLAVVVAAFVGFLYWPLHHDWGAGDIGTPEHRLAVHLKTRWQGGRLDYIFTVHATPDDLRHYSNLTFLLQDSGGFTLFQREIDVDRELAPGDAGREEARDFVLTDATAMGPMAYYQTVQWSAGFLER